MARSYPDAKLSQKKAEMALSMLLFGCKTERLRDFTPRSLAASYNVPIARAGALLDDARRRRMQ